MPEDTDITKLQARVVELENALKAVTAAKPAADLSAAEIKTYLKVREALAFDPDTASGISEFGRGVVFRCVVTPCIVRCIVRCIFECSCGPCNIGGIGGGGLGRFSELGG